MFKLVRTLSLGSVLVWAGVAAPGPAEARIVHRLAPYEDGAPLEGVQPGRFQPDGQACVKQCPDDRNPCDPPAFKHADGRCSTQWR